MQHLQASIRSPSGLGELSIGILDIEGEAVVGGGTLGWNDVHDILPDQLVVRECLGQRKTTLVIDEFAEDGFAHDLELYLGGRVVGAFDLKLRIQSNAEIKTSRYRHKSALYLRFKNSTRTSKCQVLSSTVPEEPQKLDRTGAPGAVLLDFLSTILLQSINKIEGDPLETLKNFRKKN